LPPGLEGSEGEVSKDLNGQEVGYRSDWRPMETKELTVQTGRTFATDLTAEIAAFTRGKGDGLLSVFVPHATAGVAVMETGSGSEPDLADAVERLLPTSTRYRHQHGTPGHGRDHVLPALIAPSVTVPVIEGEAALGTWQSVVLIDTNVDNEVRHVRLSFLAG
jgi:secondary thiamine-phosphate synthase enzyme